MRRRVEVRRLVTNAIEPKQAAPDESRQAFFQPAVVEGLEDHACLQALEREKPFAKEPAGVESPEKQFRDQLVDRLAVADEVFTNGLRAIGKRRGAGVDRRPDLAGEPYRPFGRDDAVDGRGRRRADEPELIQQPVHERLQGRHAAPGAIASMPARCWRAFTC